MISNLNELLVVMAGQHESVDFHDNLWTTMTLMLRAVATTPLVSTLPTTAAVVETTQPITGFIVRLLLFFMQVLQSVSSQT